MGEWFTARELAALKLPDLPASVNRLRVVARDRGWTARARGAEREFHVSNLSERARTALARFLSDHVLGATRPQADEAESRAAAETQPLVAPRVNGLPAIPADRALVAISELAPHQSAKAFARAEVVGALYRYRDARGISITAAAHGFAEAYNAGQIEVAAGTRALIKRVSAPTLLARWTRAHTTAALAPKQHGGHRKHFLQRNPDIEQFLIAAIIERRDLITNADLWDLAQRRFELPGQHRRQVIRWCRSWRADHKLEVAIATNPDRATGAYMPAYGDMAQDVVRFLQRAELDGSPFDLLTLNGVVRVVVIEDVWSRFGVAILAPSESADATGRLLAKFFRRLGIPDEIVTDNGSGFVSERISQLLRNDLRIEYRSVKPYSGYLKPFIESYVRMVQRHAALMPGAKGRNVAQRDQLRGALTMAERRGKAEHEILRVELTRDDAESMLDRLIEERYANRPHKGLRGRTPNQMLAEFTAAGGRARRIEDERVLAALLMERGLRVVTKKGISVDGAYYASPELVPYAGSQVHYRRHPDPGKLAVYSDGPRPQFICLVENLDLLDGTERQALAMDARAVWGALKTEVRKGARRLQRIIGQSAAEIILEASTAAGRIEIAAVPLTTPATEAIASGIEADALAQLPPPPHDPETLAQGDRAIRQLSQQSVALNAEESWALYRKLLAGAEPDDREREYLERFGFSLRTFIEHYPATDEGKSYLRWFGPGGDSQVA